MRILRMMQRKRMVFTLACAVMAMILATGCGKEAEKKEEPIQVNLTSDGRQAEQSEETNPIQNTEKDSLPQTDDRPNEDNSQENPASGNEETDSESVLTSGNEETDSSSVQAPEKEELVGDVISTGQDSFVISRIMTSSDGNVAIAVSPGHEEADDLVTVYVQEDCSYQYYTVRNGGVKPEDIAVREGSFGDLREGLTCVMKGSWKEGSFYADSIVMEEIL